jgi:uncharacterized protein YjbJ (UPF0337 family)
MFLKLCGGALIGAHMPQQGNGPEASRLNHDPPRRNAMDWNQVEGNWKQGKLTDDDLDVINGKQEQLEGRLQQRYGYAKDQAAKEVNDWYGRQKW